MSPARRLVGAGIAALILFGCGETTARTQLMLVADTDISDLDTIRFEIRGGEPPQSAETSELVAGPATLALVPKGSNLGPLTVTARGLRNGESVVERSAQVSFVARQTLVVPLHLLAGCIGVSCGEGETCTESGCAPQELGDDQLSAWTGLAPGLQRDTLDAGLAEAGLEDAQAEDTGAAPDSAADTDAGTEVTWTDCGIGANRVDLATDVAHCGSCRNMCRSTARNTVPTCELGECGSQCRANFGDCDQNPNNGCEQSLILQNHCGMCGYSCQDGTICRAGSCM